MPKRDGAGLLVDLYTLGVEALGQGVNNFSENGGRDMFLVSHVAYLHVGEIREDEADDGHDYPGLAVAPGDKKHAGFLLKNVQLLQRHFFQPESTLKDVKHGVCNL